MWRNLQQLAPESTANDPNPTLKNYEEDDEFGEDEEEWIQNLFSNSALKMHPPLFSVEDLSITSTEEAAEMYILGRSHWEYSKVCLYNISLCDGHHY